MTACGRGATISATLLRTTSPQLLQEPRGLSAPLTSAIASGLIKSLSTQGTLVLSEKQNPEMEQLLEVSLDELVEDEESKSGVRLAKT